MEEKSICRCPWSLCHPLAIEYHDTEWGIPVHDEQKHFEFLCLEAMQAGLNWLMILKKRESIRNAFENFDYNKIALYDEEQIQRILVVPGIIKSRKKIEAIINNAYMFIKIQNEFGSFDKYIWDFVDGIPIDNNISSPNEVPAVTDLSDKVSKDLKQRGFKFLGSITVYAHLQATGIVNDHLTSCFRYKSGVNI